MVFAMTTSTAQYSANRRNAQKSTGPLTVVGKQTVSRNPIKHGIFAKDLVLPHEDPEAYYELLRQLETELQPRGILEQVLVERIAVAIWRQKRLIRAEAAYLAAEQSEQKIAAAVSQVLGFSQPVSTAELSGMRNGVVSWCKGILDEIQSIQSEEWPTFADLKIRFPLLFAYLSNQAETDPHGLEAYLLSIESPGVYLSELTRYCHRQLKLAERNALVLEVAEMVKSQRAILKENMRESLARYQMVLDNQLYKAVRALMELRVAT
ncbi:MAG: hypothetical protein RLZ92_1848 [Pseudomonadota bacterium]